MKTKKIDDYTDEEVLRDGETIRVPMFVMDGVQQAVATRYQVADAYALHKPGYRNVQTLSDAKTLHGARVWGRTPESRRQHKREETAAAEDARASAYEGRNRYLADAYRQPFRDAAEMQAGYHPAIAIGYGEGRDVRGPKVEAGIPDSEAAYQASKIAASNAWRLPSNALNLPFTPMYQRYDPNPGMGERNESNIAQAKARIAEANDRKEEAVGVAREDYMRRTGEAWRQGSARFRRSPNNATAIEKQAEGWRGGA
jgi:hypothetical protein